MVPPEPQDGDRQLLPVEILAVAPSLHLAARAWWGAAGQRRIEIRVGQSHTDDDLIAGRPADKGALVGGADLPIVSIGRERASRELLAIEDYRLGDRAAAAQERVLVADTHRVSLSKMK